MIDFRTNKVTRTFSPISLMEKKISSKKKLV